MYGVEDAYFVRRFENEIAAADIATCDKARLIHLELAVRYSMLAKTALEASAKPIRTVAVAGRATLGYQL